MYAGKTFIPLELPVKQSRQARESMGDVDDRLEPLAAVIGVEVGGASKAWSLQAAGNLAVFSDTVADEPIVVVWDAKTHTAVSFSSQYGGRQLTFTVDGSAPATAPFKDSETGAHWTLAGRAVDGELRGKELNWINSIQCRWYAWIAEYPDTELQVPGE